MSGTVPSIRVEKLKEPTECLQCSWEIEPGQVAVVDGDLVFCSDRCRRIAERDPRLDLHLDLGGES